MPKTLGLLVCLSLCVRVAGAGEENPEPKALAQAAGEVLQAIAAGDSARARTVAEQVRPDPWLVADELIGRGERKAATALASASTHPDVAGLVAFVVGYEGDEPAVRKALRDAQTALKASDPQRALEIVAGMHSGNPLFRAQVLGAKGEALRALGRTAEALRAYEAGGAVAEQIGWLAFAARQYWRAGAAAARARDLESSLRFDERLLAVEKRRERPKYVAAAMRNIGWALAELGRFKEAVTRYEEALPVVAKAKDEAGRAAVWFGLGRAWNALHEIDKAIGFFEQALEVRARLGDARGDAWCRLNLGQCFIQRGERRRSIPHSEAAVATFADQRMPHAEAIALGNLGVAHFGRGDYAGAQAIFERVLAVERELGRESGVAWALGVLGNIQFTYGNHARAIALTQQALDVHERLGEDMATAQALLVLGGVHGVLGELERATALHQRALEIAQRIKANKLVGVALNHLGSDYWLAGEYDAALEYLEAALAAYGSRALNDRIQTLGVIGNVLVAKGELDAAAARYAQALALEGDSRDRVLQIHLAIGDLELARARPTQALVKFEQAVSEATLLGLREVEVHGLRGKATALNALRKPREALSAVRLAATRLTRLVGGLSEEQGAAARGAVRKLFDEGLRAALTLPKEERAAEVAFHIESSRAGTLLESLKAREGLFASQVPATLREAQLRAREEEKDALTAYREARRTQDFSKTRAAAGRLEMARAALDEVVARIRREAKAAASLVYPEPADLPALQKTLRAEEALVLYALLPDDAVALVITPTDARVVSLGSTQDVEQAAAIRLDDADSEVSASLRALTKRVFDPLALSDHTKRLLVSAEGGLTAVPFGLLAPSREIVQLPSGTVYRFLRNAEQPSGTDILAVGDPVYAKASRLVPLPGTRVEIEGIGAGVKLLGKRATERALWEAAGRTWRAVHIACHGLLDTEVPMRTSLALTPGDGMTGS